MCKIVHVKMVVIQIKMTPIIYIKICLNWSILKSLKIHIFKVTQIYVNISLNNKIKRKLKKKIVVS